MFFCGVEFFVFKFVLILFVNFFWYLGCFVRYKIVSVNVLVIVLYLDKMKNKLLVVSLERFRFEILKMMILY